MKDNEIREKILSILIHNKKTVFSDLWDKKVPSNKFTYHLNQLIEEGYVKKDKDQKYALTTKGKTLESSLDGETGKKRQRPFVAALLVVRKNGKYLLYHRTKEPYYGFYGLPGAKVEFGENILSCAKRELFEETGLSGDAKIFSVINFIIKENGELLSHFTQFVILIDNPKGELIKENREGDYQFVNKTEFYKKNKKGILFPDNLIIFKNIQKNDGTLHFYEMSFDIVNSKFTNFVCEKIC
ncbi:MAG: NUDIX domain-containing protein [archaeon]|jgi:ADP-ribose pyrophosphatase YjhB (NUDIX family)/predicted transcriptional regulator